MRELGPINERRRGAVLWLLAAAVLFGGQLLALWPARVGAPLGAVRVSSTVAAHGHSGCGSAKTCARRVKPPTRLAGVAGPLEVRLTWSAPRAHVDGYYVYRDGIRIARAKQPEYTDTGLRAGTPYSYYVVAHRHRTTSRASKRISVTPLQPSSGTASSRDAGGSPLDVTGAQVRDLVHAATTAPATSTAPALSGSVVVGAPITANSGGWTGALSVSYQWFSCDAVGLGCVAVGGATGSSYVPGWGDLGDTLFVRVTASNAVGSRSVDSGLSPAVGLGSGTPSVGNLWVSPAGGSCVRSASAVAFSAATACGSLRAAYVAAQCGDVVLIQGGDYSGTRQFMTDVPSKDSCTSPVVMEAAPGAVAVFGVIGNYNNMPGPSWVVFRNLSMTGTKLGFGGSNGFYVNGSHVTLDRITGGAFLVQGGRDVLIENSTFGPCSSSDDGTTDCNLDAKVDNTVAPYTAGVTIRNNTFKQFRVTRSGDHWECLFIRGGQDIMVDSNRFHVCQNYGIFFQPTSGSPDGIGADHTVVQNNWFDEIGGYQGVARQTGVDIAPYVKNTLIRYNSFDQNSTITGNIAGNRGRQVRVYGNTGALKWAFNYGFCVPGVLYSHNRWYTGGANLGNAVCSRTDRALPPSAARP